ncbi:S-2-hydroxy-acid oxidase [Penicillium taxi]|uniref:S-2-hydroxy-acid oxidase n=1 Tax=Penicillium taxi TaxID=168475 RepID=UPI00254570FA|nr:S-2-hydroxy-acid oxidase [Penicillium taxi]KAJ5899321.1 S-2-hydroxy-acid oxidase [Penicillium taxi]
MAQEIAKAPLLLTVSDYEEIAHQKLQHKAWNYYSSTADDGITARRNQSAFERLLIRPRVLRDVSSINTKKTLFGTEFPFPIGFSPSAAASTGALLILSSSASFALEEVAQTFVSHSNSTEFWYQIYILTDRAASLDRIRKAEAAGAKALVLTVDTPVIGNRLNERRSPLKIALLNQDPSPGTAPEGQDTSSSKTAAAAPSANKLPSYVHDPSLNWQDISWLRTQTSLKIIVKGILTAEDALLAIEHKVDGIVVSNHGGRQLDTVSSTIEALPEIVAAVRGRVPVLVDGGVRRGSDIFKALALGADFVLLGRPVLWGLASDAQQGVEDVIGLLEQEFVKTMQLAGATTVGGIEKSMLGVQNVNGFGILSL